MRLLALAGGLTLGIAAWSNRPPIPNADARVAVVVVLVLVVAAFLAGRREGQSRAEATASSESASTSTSKAGGGRADSRVQVVVVPQGVDAQALAAAVGSTAYSVDAPPDVLSDAPRQALERHAGLRAPLEQG